MKNSIHSLIAAAHHWAQLAQEAQETSVHVQHTFSPSHVETGALWRSLVEEVEIVEVVLLSLALCLPEGLKSKCRPYWPILVVIYLTSWNLDIVLGIVDVSWSEVLLSLLSKQASLFDGAGLYPLWLRLDVGRLFFCGCCFPLQAVLNVLEGRLIVLVPLLELFNLGPECGNEQIQAWMLLHHFLMENPALVGILGLDEDGHFPEEAPWKGLFLRSDLSFGEVEEGSVLNELLLGPLDGLGRRIRNGLWLGAELERTSLNFCSHVRIYFMWERW